MSNQSVSWHRVVVVAAVAICAIGSVAVRADDVEKPWDNSVALGLTVARGNTHSETLNATVAGNKIWAKDQLRLQADESYGVTSGKQSAKRRTAARNGITSSRIACSAPWWSMLCTTVWPICHTG